MIRVAGGAPVALVVGRRDRLKARSDLKIMIWVKGIEAKASNMV